MPNATTGLNAVISSVTRGLRPGAVVYSLDIGWAGGEGEGEGEGGGLSRGLWWGSNGRVAKEGRGAEATAAPPLRAARLPLAACGGLRPVHNQPLVQSSWSPPLTLRPYPPVAPQPTPTRYGSVKKMLAVACADSGATHVTGTVPLPVR